MNRLSFAPLLIGGLCVLPGCGRTGGPADTPGPVSQAAAASPGDRREPPAAVVEPERVAGVSDEGRFEGEWLLDSVKRFGATDKLPLMRSSWIRFQDGVCVTTDSNDDIDSQAFVLDPTTTPRSIDLVDDGEEARRRFGIYRFDGDVLWICLADTGSPRPKSFDSGNQPENLYAYRRINAFEKAALEGDSPADSWVKEGAPALGWEVLLPFLPTADSKFGVERRFVRLKSSIYFFSRGYFPASGGVDGIIAGISPRLGKATSRVETTTKSGLPAVDVTFQDESAGRMHRVRLVQRDEVLYELRVGGSEAFVRGPDAERFLESLRLVDAEDKIPDLAKSLMSDDLTVREAAYRTLLNLDRAKLPRSASARRAVPDLIKVVQSPEAPLNRDFSSRRCFALSLLGSMGANAEAAVPAVAQAMLDPERDVHRTAFDVIQAIIPRWDGSEAARGALVDLARAMASDDGRICSYVYGNLSQLGARAAAAAPGLVYVLRQAPKPYLRRDAAVLLGVVGDSGDAVASGLVDALGDPDQEVRQYAGEALNKLGAAVVPQVARAADRAGWDGRDGAIQTLGRFGDAARGSIASLSRALRDDDLYVRAASAEALGRIGPAASSVVPALITALDDEQGRVRRASAEALGRIGPAARQALPALQRMGQHNDYLGGPDIARKAMALIGGR